MKQDEARPYIPSNATEGDIFMAANCAQCILNHTDLDSDEDPCGILTAAMAYQIGRTEFPEEWITDDRGPRCTAFRQADTDEPAPLDPSAVIRPLL